MPKGSLIEVLTILAVVAIVLAVAFGDPYDPPKYEDTGQGVVTFRDKHPYYFADTLPEYLKANPNLQVQTVNELRTDYLTVVFIEKEQANAETN